MCNSDAVAEQPMCMEYIEQNNNIKYREKLDCITYTNITIQKPL